LPAPVITHTRDVAASFSDTIEGTIAGEPGSRVVVSLASTQRTPDGIRPRSMAGEAVESLGSVGVDIGPDGSGAFQLARRLGPQRFVYGIAVRGPAVSAVGECAAVTTTDPTVSVDDAEVVESAASMGATTTPTAPTVRFADPSESPVTVATADGTATSPADCVRFFGVGKPYIDVAFAPGCMASGARSIRASIA